MRQFASNFFTRTLAAFATNWSTMRLSTTLVLMVLVPFLLVVGITAAYSITQLERNTQARMQEDIELIARAIRLPLSHALERGREGTVERALESAFSINRVYGVYVYDDSGNTIYASGVRDAAMRRRQAQTIVETKGDQGEFFQAGDEQVFSYFVPLVDAGERIIGLLQVTRRGSEFEEYLGSVQRQSLSVILIATVLLTLIIVLGHRWVVGRHLNAAQKSLLRIQRDESKHRLRPAGPRELRLLFTNINDMLEAIENSQGQLALQNRREVELKEQLHQSQKLAALGQLAGGVAHELGSPLSTIDGCAQRALRDDKLADKVRHSLEAIRAQSSRMSQIIRQLLDFGRLNPLKLRTLPAAQPLLSAVKILDEEGDWRAAIQVDLDSLAHQAHVRVDPVRLEQALLNLIRNALQAANKRVIVSCGVFESDIYYGVEDDGPGIDDAIKPYLFDPFFTTKPTGQGTGLGLAVAEAAARDHKGSVKLVSGEPGGTVFHVILPRETDDES